MHHDSQSVLYAFGDRELSDDDREAIGLIDRFGAADATRILADREAEWAREVDESPLAFLDGHVPPGDAWLLEQPYVADFAAGFREGVRQGATGVNADWVACLLPWEFNLGDISCLVAVWFGAQDTLVAESDFRRLASVIPEATFTRWSDVGHAGFAKHFDRVLASALCREAQRP